MIKNILQLIMCCTSRFNHFGILLHSNENKKDRKAFKSEFYLFLNALLRNLSIVESLGTENFFFIAQVFTSEGYGKKKY